MDYCQTRLKVKRRICESAESDKRDTLEILCNFFKHIRINFYYTSITIVSVQYYF